MKCNHSCPGIELVSPCPYPVAITITPRAPPKNSSWNILIDDEYYSSRNKLSVRQWWLHMFERHFYLSLGPHSFAPVTSIRSLVAIQTTDLISEYIFFDFYLQVSWSLPLYLLSLVLTLTIIWLKTLLPLICIQDHGQFLKQSSGLLDLSCGFNYFSFFKLLL